MGLGAYDHGNLPFSEHSSPTFKRSKDSSIYPLFFIFLRTLVHIFALMQNSTHLFSSNSVLFAQYTRGGRRGTKHSLFTRSSGVVYSLGCCGPW
jgi:hypothetical protein